MSDPAKAAQVWAEALSNPDAGADAVAELLAPDVKTVSALGTTEGRDDVLATFGQSPIAALFARGNWSEPASTADSATLTCKFAAGAPVGGVTVTVRVNDAGLIAHVESTVIPAAPAEVAPLRVTDGMGEALAGALANGTPVVVAYADSEGQPHLSLRGTVQAFGDDQLAMWIRNPEGGLLRALPSNPRLALFYRDPKTRTSYQFHGRGRRDDDPSVRERVFVHSPEPERNLDPQQRGIAVLIDLDRIEGREAGTPVRMERTS